jgi:DedD protein
MEEKNELNDIILNRSNGNNGMKKIMLAVASLAILLIIVVIIMSSINSDGTANLPQAVEPPKIMQNASPLEEDPLFEPVAVDELPSQEESLDQVAKKIKEQSQEVESENELISGPGEIIEEEPTEVLVPSKYEKPVVKESTPVKKAAKPVPSSPAIKGEYYIQVGSFSRYAPDKKFLKKITNSGYRYKLHEAVVNGKSLTKVLVGPYANDKAARKDLSAIRASIESGAFLSRI